MNFTCKKFFIMIISLHFTYNAIAKEHLIFSVSEDLPMGYANEQLRRNYYVNMGGNQGLRKGTILNVFRKVAKSNPYKNEKRVTYQIPIGKLEVIHFEDEYAVTLVKKLNLSLKDPIFEINNFMIGDNVTVSTD